ncbi:hypothetical protein AURANDRAFT_61495 [Aureococcus anophagefferens]|uniref:PI31 proteasome regulator N-terminal domain-containing protein n=1 Tax=Aureococcus anophagefferens TaxID=44056 RepID=F0Y097_AURAN|nr:hypothetical protein AURANDRAFT_61495 [Aureococcus anophagefferens]EGB11184.1 hypothetical protein AURANDRAFT_61495 [Aureococcus anophagefferens]|eukprot:XP_009033577.1 hypothetical protein AURANDRAFT_61495 [Aureococcus anophagefferens]
MAQLHNPNDCDAAEEQLASLAVAVNRLPAGSFVRSGVEAALAELRSAVDARRAALGAPTPTPAAALALDARSLLARSLDACDAAHRPATNFEAAACAVHALLLAAAPELSCVGVASTAAAVGGFAPAARALPRDACLPRGWRREGGGAGFRYRGGADALEFAAAPAGGELQISLASPTRGVVHADGVAVADGGAPASGPPPLAAFEALAAYVAGTVLPRLRAAAAAPAPAAPAPRAPPRPAAPAVGPGFPPAAPRRPQPFGDPLRDDGRRLLVGPGHPAFGGFDPLTAGRFQPRFDPVGPLGPGFPGGAPPGGGRGRRRPGPGEPDFDHMRVPGLDDGPGGGFI